MGPHAAVGQLVTREARVGQTDIPRHDDQSLEELRRCCDRSEGRAYFASCQ